MRAPAHLRLRLFAVIAVFVPALALITLPLYGAASLSAYFFLQFAILALLLTGGLWVFFGKVTLTIDRLPFPVLFLAGWLLFILLHWLLTEQTVTIRVELYVGLSLYLLLTWLLFENKWLAAGPLLTLL